MFIERAYFLLHTLLARLIRGVSESTYGHNLLRTKLPAQVLMEIRFPVRTAAAFTSD